eukprot:481981_1
MSLIFKQLFSKATSTYTYLIGCNVTRKALLIDGVLEETARDIKLIQELGLDLEYSINTHMHADHVRSCEELKKVYPSLKAVQGDKLGKSDIMIQNGDVIECGKSVKLECLSTPGHTPGCFSYVLKAEHRCKKDMKHKGKDNKHKCNNPQHKGRDNEHKCKDNEHHHDMVFTGDAMLIRGCGRTDFQDGNPSDLYDSIQKTLFGLADATLVYPGHDYVGFTSSSVAEEKKYNKRCAEGVSREEFIEVMNNLELDPPQNIEYNVTENRKRG